MSNTAPRYGTLDRQLARQLMAVPADQDGPFWMLNLMRYRPLAVYEDGRQTELTGQQADDAYSPVDVLEAIGARVVLFGDVVEQLRGDEGWHRVAIVEYPSARSFMDMQRRPDFVARHVHKDAGMERTVVAVCHPQSAPLPGSAGEGTLVLDLVTGPLPEEAAQAGDAVFLVEGVLVGDETPWTTLRTSFWRKDETPRLLASNGAATTVKVAVGLDLMAQSVDACARSTA